MVSRGSIHLCGRGRFRAPPSLDGSRPWAHMGPGAQQAERGIQDPRLSHPRLSAAAGRDAVAAVLLEVAVQVVRAHKSLKAARALIGAQAGVHAHVVLQVIVVSKGGSTLRAQVRLFSCMLPHMNLELVLPVREKYNASENEIKTQRRKDRFFHARRPKHSHWNMLGQLALVILYMDGAWTRM